MPIPQDSAVQLRESLPQVPPHPLQLLHQAQQPPQVHHALPVQPQLAGFQQLLLSTQSHSQFPQLNQQNSETDFQAALELIAFIQNMERLAHISPVARHVLNSLRGSTYVRQLSERGSFKYFRLIQERHEEEYAPLDSSNNKLEISLEIANVYYSGEIIGEVQVKMPDNTYVPYNCETYTLNCVVEAVVHKQLSTVYHTSCKSSNANVIKHPNGNSFGSRICRVCFRKSDDQGVIAYSNQFEIILNDGDSIHKTKRQRR